MIVWLSFMPPMELILISNLNTWHRKFNVGLNSRPLTLHPLALHLLTLHPFTLHLLALRMHALAHRIMHIDIGL
jgi:hypothetical protein